MSAKRFRQTKGRSESGTFASLPHDVIRSANWQQLSGNGVKLVIELLAQFNGKNNGDMSAPFSQMKGQGWKSTGTLKRAEREALHYGLLQKTRQGGMNRCNLYAVTWKPIDDCKRKLDVDSSCVAVGTWKTETPPFQNKTPSRNST